MHKLKVWVGIGMIAVSVILLLIEVPIAISDEIGYRNCHDPNYRNPNPVASYSFPYQCFHSFREHNPSVFIKLCILGAGILVLVFGLKEISLASFSRE